MCKPTVTSPICLYTIILKSDITVVATLFFFNQVWPCLDVRVALGKISWLDLSVVAACQSHSSHAKAQSSLKATENHSNEMFAWIELVRKAVPDLKIIFYFWSNLKLPRVESETGCGSRWKKKPGVKTTTTAEVLLVFPFVFLSLRHRRDPEDARCTRPELYSTILITVQGTQVPEEQYDLYHQPALHYNIKYYGRRSTKLQDTSVNPHLWIYIYFWVYVSPADHRSQ